MNSIMEQIYVLMLKPRYFGCGSVFACRGTKSCTAPIQLNRDELAKHWLKTKHITGRWWER